MTLHSFTIAICACFLFSCQPGKGQPSDTEAAQLTPVMQELMKEWEGQAHRFEIDECTIRYNGKPFFLGTTLAELEGIFGAAPDRQKGYFYGWNELGVSVVKEKKSSAIDVIRFYKAKGREGMMDVNDQVLIFYGIPLNGKRLFGEYLSPLRDKLGAVYVMENSYEIREKNCPGSPVICSVSSSIKYKTEQAGHFQLSKEYDPSVTYPVDRISIYKSSK